MTLTEAQIERAAIVIYMMHNSRSERDWRAIDQTTRNYYKYLAKQAFDAAMEAERGVSTLEIAKIKSALPLYDERAIFEIIQQYRAVRKQLQHRDMGPGFTHIDSPACPILYFPYPSGTGVRRRL